MPEIEERVETLEAIFGRYLASAEVITRRLEQNIHRLDANLEELRRDSHANLEELRRGNDASLEELRRDSQANLEELRRGNDASLEELRRDSQANLEELRRGNHASLEELRRESREHTLEMARIADRIGRFAEDIVAPNIPRLAREAFGLEPFDLSCLRIEKPSSKHPDQWREFDSVVVGQKKLLLTEVKSTARVKYIDEFADSLKEVFDYFPEYRGYALIPVFASMALSPDFVRRLTRLKIYALALGTRTMELLNQPEVAARRNGSHGGHK
jgi:bifunctional DNA-binding transcriptional regulator/antitoxin component of YhaV-PrlF toxin-antitoxin module